MSSAPSSNLYEEGDILLMMPRTASVTFAYNLATVFLQDGWEPWLEDVLVVASNPNVVHAGGDVVSGAVGVSDETLVMRALRPVLWSVTGDDGLDEDR